MNLWDECQPIIERATEAAGDDAVALLTVRNIAIAVMFADEALAAAVDGQPLDTGRLGGLTEPVFLQRIVGHRRAAIMMMTSVDPEIAQPPDSSTA